MTAGAAALLAASAALVAMAPPAPAMQQASEQVALEKALDKTYPPIPGQWPSSADPTTCSVADFCDTIPIFVHEPTGIPAGDDFYLEVIISWPGGAAADDMDAVLYDNGQTEDEIDKAGTRDPTAPPKASRYTDKKSASDGEPLIIKLPEPRLGQYNLVVVHGLGVSQGYRVQAHLVIQKFVPPFESLEPPDNGVTTQGSDDAPPPDNSLGPGPSTDPFTTQEGPVAPGTSLDEVVPQADSELDGLRKPRAGRSDTGLSTEGALPTVAAKPPKPPSGAALLFWLAAVPGGLLGGLAFWLVKRRRAGFTFG